MLYETGALGGVMGSELDSQTFTNEFEFHWATLFIWPCATSNRYGKIRQWINRKDLIKKRYKVKQMDHFIFIMEYHNISIFNLFCLRYIL